MKSIKPNAGKLIGEESPKGESDLTPEKESTISDSNIKQFVKICEPHYDQQVHQMAKVPRVEAADNVIQN